MLCASDLRIPVAVIEDNGVSSHEVEADAAGAGGEEEDEGLGVLEARDGAPPLLAAHRAVEALVGVAAPGEVVLENVQGGGALAEEEDAVAVAT